MLAHMGKRKTLSSVNIEIVARTNQAEMYWMYCQWQPSSVISQLRVSRVESEIVWAHVRCSTYQSMVLLQQAMQR